MPRASSEASQSPSAATASAPAHPSSAFPSLLTIVLGRVDSTVTRVIRHAISKAGRVEQLGVERLWLSLLALDGGFIFRKLRNTGVRVPDMMQQLRNDAHDCSHDDLSSVVTTLLLTGDLAPPATRINTQHLFVAILLEGTNRVAGHVIDSGVDLPRLLVTRFSCMPNAPEVLRTVSSEGLPRRRFTSQRELQSALSAALDALPGAPSARTAPQPNRGPSITAPANDRLSPERIAEDTARRWLRKLIPDQAESYSMRGCIQIESTLFPGRVYRLHRSGQLTEVCKGGKTVARSCIHLRDSTMPPTDKVIAEYFLIRGDEKGYLATANVTPC
jgi:hypothetical protein